MCVSKSQVECIACGKLPLVCSFEWELKMHGFDVMSGTGPSNGADLEVRKATLGRYQGMC